MSERNVGLCKTMLTWKHNKANMPGVDFVYCFVTLMFMQFDFLLCMHNKFSL
jgi:hypothetical protein